LSIGNAWTGKIRRGKILENTLSLAGVESFLAASCHQDSFIVYFPVGLALATIRIFTAPPAARLMRRGRKYSLPVTSTAMAMISPAHRIAVAITAPFHRFIDF
jgi:hypothetical protein